MCGETNYACLVFFYNLIGISTTFSFLLTCDAPELACKLSPLMDFILFYVFFSLSLYSSLLSNSYCFLDKPEASSHWFCSRGDGMHTRRAAFISLHSGHSSSSAENKGSTSHGGLVSVGALKLLRRRGPWNETWLGPSEPKNTKIERLFLKMKALHDIS